MQALTTTPSATFSIENLQKLCDELASKESIFKNIIDTYGYPPLWHREPGFQTLVHIILEQQVSLASALAAFQKLKTRLGAINPMALLGLTDSEMKACYFSRQKMIYVRDLAQAITGERLQIDRLHELSNEDVIDQLTLVKGIGLWTADVYLMMVLHRSDCFPINDIALVKSMKHELQLSADAGKTVLLSIAENWRPHRTIAAYLLWHAYLSGRNS